MSSYYTLEQQATLAKLKAMHAIVSDQTLHSGPCKLMLSQLYELKVLSNKLHSLTSEMIEATKERLDVREDKEV